jgi:thymidylate kinase
MIIECAGLPGAGKSTVCKLVTEPYAGKGSVPLSHLRFDRAMWLASWRIASLCACARPFRLNRLKRGFNLIIFLRHYQHKDRNVLLDQGMVQKLWSILAEAMPISEEALASILSTLTPFAPDCFVWVETPAEIAAARLGARADGKSRYDKLQRSDATVLLRQREELLRKLAERFCSIAGISTLVLKGDAIPETNAARIDDLLRAARNADPAVQPKM